MVNNTEYNDKIKAKIIELKKDPSLNKLIKLRQQLDKFNKKLAKRDSKSTRKALEKVKVNIQKLIDNKSTSPAIAKEAETLLGK